MYMHFVERLRNINKNELLLKNVRNVHNRMFHTCFTSVRETCMDIRERINGKSIKFLRNVK